jgi:hypothetical protein
MGHAAEAVKEDLFWGSQGDSHEQIYRPKTCGLACLLLGYRDWHSRSGIT